MTEREQLAQRSVGTPFEVLYFRATPQAVLTEKEKRSGYNKARYAERKAKKLAMDTQQYANWKI